MLSQCELLVNRVLSLVHSTSKDAPVPHPARRYDVDGRERPDPARTGALAGGRIHFITYHENGQVKEVGCFRNGRRDGIWKQYSDTGALLTRAGFRNGERQGVWEFRDAQDLPMGQLSYSSGRLTHGTRYDAVGALASHRTY